MIPTLDDLASDPLRHRFDDHFNPPGLTNFLGTAQVDHDLVAVRSVNFPPLGSGDTISGTLFLDGRLFRSYAAEVTVRWRPDRVVRSARVGDLELETVTVCPPGETAAVVELRARNLGGAERSVRVGFSLASAVTRRERWGAPEPPSAANDVDVVDDAFAGVCPASGAACVQGIDRAGTWLAANLVETTLTIAPGATERVGCVQALGTSAGDARDGFRRLVRDVPGALAGSERLWARELTEVFEPGAGSFAGSLPVLETESEALRKLYWLGLLGVLFMRRDSPHSALGRAYDTLLPRYWHTTTFIWDYSLSSVVHALLDAPTMRRQLEHWLSVDVLDHYGTEWLTGEPIGVWYSVNDYALTRLVRDYVRFTGEVGWLDTVGEHVQHWARRWQSLRRGHALADYGGVENLLECVSTYTNEVASLNATNVWCLRVAAEVAEQRGDAAEAARLRAEAAELATAVLELYAGGGHWNARRPDGTLVPVRHCYDFQTTGYVLAGELGEERRRELVEFFVREFQTETWMRALATSDPDAAFSVRPDHQWNGAYTAWPSEAALALFRLGADDVALDWLSGLARSANQGPFAQAHFVEGLVPTGFDGAPKSPPQFPYLIDWACSSSGSFVQLVLEGVFGVDVSLTGEVTAQPRVARLDPAARLRGLVVAGRTYDVDANGLA